MPIRMTGMVSGLDTESIVSALVSSYSSKKEKLVKEQTTLSWTQDAWKDINTQVHDLYTTAGAMKFSSAYSLKKAVVSDTTKANVTASGEAPNGTQMLKISQLAQSGYLTGGKISLGDSAKSSGSTLSKDSTMSDLGLVFGTTDETKEKSFTIKVGMGDTAKETKITVNGDTKLSSLMSQLSSAGVTANFDVGNGRIYLTAKESGADGDFTLTESDSNVDGTGKGLFEALGLGDAASKVKGQNAKITLNGVDYESKTNQFNINGLSIEATGITDGEISVTTNTDSQGIYDKVKDFFSQYNEIVNKLQKLYNADSATGYDPLTDDQKAAMSDTEVEKWESKIKGALLRKDTTLGGIITAMTSAMSGTYEVNGKQMALSNFGIKTLSYFVAPKNENYAFHIDGDADDSTVSGNEDELMKAINEDPDAVVDFMKKITGRLYDNLGNKMKSTSMRSAYTIYNDKEMASEYSDYTTNISTWEKKLEDMEDAYYKKFSSMESALQKLQSSTSSITGMMG